MNKKVHCSLYRIVTEKKKKIFLIVIGACEWSLLVELLLRFKVFLALQGPYLNDQNACLNFVILCSYQLTSNG